MTPGELANLLLHRRTALGLSLEDAAAEAKASESQVRAWEAGESVVLDGLAAWLEYAESIGIELRCIPVKFTARSDR